MSNLFDILFSALLFAISLALFLFAKPLYPAYATMPRDIAVLGTLLIGLYVAVGVWAARPELRLALCVVIVLAQVPAIYIVLTSPWPLF
jgi:hypothetical protein